MDALHQELLAVFAGEYRMHMRALRALTAHERVPVADGIEIFRRLHSLKGAARAVELRAVEALCHGLESRLADATRQRAREDEGLDPALIADVRAGLDAIETAMEAPEQPDRPASERPRSPVTRYVQLSQGLVDELQASARTLTAAIEDQLRHWALLDALFPRDVRHPSGELGRKLRALDAVRREHDLSVRRLQDALTHVQEDVHQAALVSVSEVFGPLAEVVQRMVRESNQACGVVVHSVGLDLAVDRHVMQEMRDPVLQILRNAIAHGSEPSAFRCAAGKPSDLRLDMIVAVSAGWLVIEICDDGCGPDLTGIAARGRARGLLHGPETPNEEALLALVFHEGFSTRAQPDALAGRGMGLSIVAERVRALGGEASLRRGVACGTSVRLSIPLPRRERSVLFVRVAGDLWALDGAHVRRLARVRGPEIRKAAEGNVWDMPPRSDTDETLTLRVTTLHAVLGLGGQAVMPEDGLPVVVMEAGGHLFALLVDAIEAARVLLVETADHPGLDRALAPEICWQSSDACVPVLDTSGVFARIERLAHGLPDVPDRPQQVLIVDDTATVRIMARMVLRNSGLRVRTVSDGIEALGLLAGTVFDCVVTDLDMAGLDGAGLVMAMQAEPSLRHIPVIVMTGRAEAEWPEFATILGGGVRHILSKHGLDAAMLEGAVRAVLAKERAR